MEALAKAVFTGKWKSFKIFKRTGAIILNTVNHYKEFHFTSEGLFTIRYYKGDTIEKIVQTDQWTVELKDKRHYLKVLLYKLVYEVVTINHTVLVLADASTDDKIFLTKEAHWDSALQSNTSLVL
jgi:hypothetical protein